MHVIMKVELLIVGLPATQEHSSCACRTACDDRMAAAVLSFHVWEGLQRAIQKFEGEMHALARHMKDRTQSKLQNLLVPMLVNDYWVQQPQ